MQKMYKFLGIKLKNKLIIIKTNYPENPDSSKRRKLNYFHLENS